MNKVAVRGGKNVKARAMFYKSKEVKLWETKTQYELLSHSNPRITESFELSVVVYFKNSRQDLDNIFKALLDVLQSVGWIANDKDCVSIIAKKRIDSLNPRYYFKLKTMWESV